MAVELHAFLTLTVDGEERSASRSGWFTPEEGVPDSRWIGGCKGPGVFGSFEEKIEIRFLSPSACSLVSMLTELSPFQSG
jgi:hypothetical protein